MIYNEVEITAIKIAIGNIESRGRSSKEVLVKNKYYVFERQTNDKNSSSRR